MGRNYDFQTGEEWQDGERITHIPEQFADNYVIDPQTGQMVWVPLRKEEAEQRRLSPSARVHPTSSDD